MWEQASILLALKKTLQMTPGYLSQYFIFPDLQLTFFAVLYFTWKKNIDFYFLSLFLYVSWGVSYSKSNKVFRKSTGVWKY